jgi:hypothetical protein
MHQANKRRSDDDEREYSRHNGGPTERRHDQIGVVNGEADEFDCTNHLQRFAAIAHPRQQEQSDGNERDQHEGQNAHEQSWPLVPLSEPEHFVGQVAIPDDQHRHKIDVGDAEYGGQQQTTAIGRPLIRVSRQARGGTHGAGVIAEIRRFEIRQQRQRFKVADRHALTDDVNQVILAE